MLRLNALTGFGGRQDASLAGALGRLGLTSGLLVCLDAGDIRSYGGSGQVWSNLAPNAGTDFFLGTTGSVDAGDPVFNGTAGALSDAEYFELDFGDKFIESAAGWGADEFVKDGYAYTVAAVIFVPAPRARTLNVLTVGTGPPYTRFGITTSDQLTFFVDPSSAAGSVNQFSGTGVTIAGGSWNFVAMTAVDVNANDSLFQANGSSISVNCNNPQGNTAPAAGPAVIGAFANGLQEVEDGTRFGAVLVWDRALSQSELTSLYGEIKSRWTAIP